MAETETSPARPQCIYCESFGPFTDEHLIPAGLGADDRRFMLRDLVCAACNTGVFSRLEAAFLRSSPTAIARMFMQPTSRRRGSKRSTPKIHANLKTMVPPDGSTVEVELGPRGQPITLPQLLYGGASRCDVTATDEAALLHFLETARSLLGDSVQLVARRPNVENLYEVESFVWSGTRYVEEAMCEASRPPRVCIWRASRVEHSKDDAHSTARLFERKSGQIVLRLAGLRPAEALTFFRNAAAQIDVSAGTMREVHQPLVRVDGMSIDIHVTSRVLAKIGVNLLAYLAGAGFIRLKTFDAIKSSILHGDPQLPIFPHTSGFAPIFHSVGHERHVFLLTSSELPDGTSPIVIVARLYGSVIDMVKLSDGPGNMPLAFPTFFTVDYLNHVVEHYSAQEFFDAFPPLIEAPTVAHSANQLNDSADND